VNDLSSNASAVDPGSPEVIMRESIRLASPADTDARAVAEVHVRSWQAAYRGLLPQDYLDGLDLTLDKREAYWREAIIQGGPGLLVAEVDGAVVG
jgi:hypothetical protein